MGVEVRLGLGRHRASRRRASTSAPSSCRCATCSGPPVCRRAPSEQSLGVPLDRAGRVIVEPDLSIPGHPEVFVAGDLASARSADTGKTVPGVAQGGIQMGRHAGRAIAEEASGRSRRSPPGVRLPRQGLAGRHRQGQGRRAHRARRGRRLPRLAPLGRDPHRVPDRLPQPAAGAPELVLELAARRPRRAPDHRRGAPRHPGAALTRARPRFRAPGERWE